MIDRARARSAPSQAFPTKLGRYRVLDELGRGGTGVVYRGRNDDSEEIVALKTTALAHRAQRAALEREISALTRLSQRKRRGIARLLEAGTESEQLWYAMEFVAGRSLRALAGTLSRDELVELGIDIAHVLRGIHADGVIHADLTLENVLLDEARTPILVDFGAAFLTHEAGTLREVSWVPSRVGTPGFMAPEQISGQLLDPRVDLYALGCILYELSTGRSPFEADSIDALLRKHLSVTPVPPSELASVDAGLSTLILALLEKTPQRRPSRADDVAFALAELRTTRRAAYEFTFDLDPILYRPRLVGRSTQLLEIEAALKQAIAGSGSVFVVSGPSGSGKTRLANEVHALAVAAGCELVSVTCAASHGNVDSVGGSAVSALGIVAAKLAGRALEADRESKELSESLAVLSAYVPQGEALAPHAPRHVPNEADVLAGLEALLGAFCARGPALLTIDDAQWADELLLRFLSDRARALAQMRVLILVTARSDVDAPRLARLDASASRVTQLDALDLEAVYALTRDLLAVDQAPDGLPEFLARHSEGNPFLVAEYLRAAVQRGFVTRRRNGEWTFDSRSADAGIGVPDSFQGLFELRLARLTPDARAILELSSVLGRQFAAADLSELTGENTPLRGDALEELVSEQILECVGAGVYRFTHDKLREVQESSLDEARRKELHRMAARALEVVANDGLSPAEREARLGLHLIHAGESAKAVGHLTTAARWCQRLHLHARATELYRTALAACEREPGPAFDRDRCAELNECLGDALLAQARNAEARSAYEASLARLETGARLERARNHRKLAASFWRLHLGDEAKRHLDHAVHALGDCVPEDGPDIQREYIELGLGRFERLYFARDTSGAGEALLDSLATVIEVHASPGQRVRYYLCAASDVMSRGRFEFSDRAVVLARRGLAVNPELLTLHEGALAEFMVGFTLMVGDQAARREALSHFERAADGARRSADRMLASRVAIYQALTLMRFGRVAETESAARRAIEYAEAAKLFPYVGAAHGCAAWVSFRRGDSAGASARVAEAQRIWQAHPGNYPFRWCAYFVALALALAREDWDAASHACQQLLDPMQQRLGVAIERELEGAIEAVKSGNVAEACRHVERAVLAGVEHGYC